MYAPNPFTSGSSVSHWDVSLSPNALMEPAINNDLHDTVDMTNGVLRDIGWFPAYVGAQSVNTTICPGNSCVTMPVNIKRFDYTPIPMLAYSVTLAAVGQPPAVHAFEHHRGHLPQLGGSDDVPGHRQRRRVVHRRRCGARSLVRSDGADGQPVQRRSVEHGRGRHGVDHGDLGTAA
jgi:hypothetical protein